MHALYLPAGFGEAAGRIQQVAHSCYVTRCEPNSLVHCVQLTCCGRVVPGCVHVQHMHHLNTITAAAAELMAVPCLCACCAVCRGMCYQGPSCTYLHRLPTSADNEAMARNTSQDIFGREKLPDRLDNREGAGSYDRWGGLLRTVVDVSALGRNAEAHVGTK